MVMSVKLGRLFALLLLATFPMLNGIARGQDASAEPPKPLVLYKCTINTACFNNSLTKYPDTDKSFTSDPKGNKYLAWQDAIDKMKKYEIDNPCNPGYARQQNGPAVFDPPYLQSSGAHDNCCPTDGKWKVTIQCIVDDGTPCGTSVNFTCFGNTRLKAKRAAEAQLKAFLCEIGQTCKCCKVFTERVKPTPCCCN
jgi:hypothetical protein